MNRQEFLTCCALEVSTLDIWLEQSWLVPEAGGAEIRFSEVDLARVHLIRDLKVDFGINDEGVDVIPHLVDQFHGLRRVLADVRKLDATSQTAIDPQSLKN